MQITTEDAKKIAGAYLSEASEHRELFLYRRDLMRSILNDLGVDKVKDIWAEGHAELFVRRLLDGWDKP